MFSRNAKTVYGILAGLLGIFLTGSSGLMLFDGTYSRGLSTIALFAFFGFATLLAAAYLIFQ